jgi:outer membrane protein TolC
LIIAVVSLSAAINFGRSQTRLQTEIKTVREELQGTRDDVARTQAEVARTQAEVARAQADFASARGELATAQRELAELKTLADAPAPPPLPRSRTGGLDDLRQQLRAAHAEDEDEGPTSD